MNQFRIELAGRRYAIALTYSLTVALSAMLMIFASNAGAQVLYGTLTGNITDSSGAVVPSANVIALNTGTGASRTVTTNSDGIYTFENLQPGQYTLSVTVTGFAPHTAEGIKISPNQTTRVNSVLSVGTAVQQIQVTSGAAPLQTDKADVNYELASVVLTELPTTSSEGRSFQSLLKLVPGNSPPSEQNSSAGNPMRAQAINANGISWVANSTRVDGSTVAYPWLPYLISYVPAQDSIESVNIVTNSFTADQGTAGGSVTNVTIKSGTNHFHGSAWEYTSNNHFNANSYFTTTPSPKNLYNEYGGDLGGPIIKDKLFFFGDFDRTTRRQHISGFQTIPTPEMIVGDFSNIPGIAIFDPATGTIPNAANGTPVGRTTFPNNKIPTGRLDPATQKLLALLPAVNNCASPCTNPVNDYLGAGAFAYSLNKADVKINYVPNQKDQVFGRYSIAPYTINDPNALAGAGGGTFDGGQQGSSSGRVQNVGLGVSHVFTQNLVLDANAGFGRAHLGAEAQDINSNFGLDTLNIPGTNGPILFDGGQPAFIFSGSSAAGFGSGGGSSNSTFSSLGNPNSGSPFIFRDNQYVGNTNLSWNRGKHQMRFGGEYTHSAINHFQPQSTVNSNLTPRGSFIFSGGVTSAPGTNATLFNILADALLGLPQNYGKTVQTLNPNALRFSTFAFYAQDQWQLTPKLTVTFGARYEYYPFATRDHEGVFRFDPSLGRTNNVIAGGISGNPTDTGEQIGWGRIVPRAGLAYRISDKTVIRAGGGQTVDPENFRTLRDTYGAVTALNVTGTSAYNTANCLQAQDAQNYVGGCSQVGIPEIATPDFSSGFLTLPTNQSTNTVPKNFRRGYINTWNLAIQQDLGAGFIMNIGYVGTSAVRITASVNINAASAPGVGNAGRQLANITGGTADINSDQPFKGSNYNGLQTQLTRRVGKGIQTGLIYTWSKAIDYDDNGTYGTVFFQSPAYWNRNRGLAGYDRTNNLQWWTVSQSPFGRNGHYLTQGFAGKVLGGWTLDTSLSKVSGTPFTIMDSGTFLNSPGNTQVADQVKPSVAIGKIHARGNGSTTGLTPYFDTSAFSPVQTDAGAGPARFGTAGRNTLRGPGFFNLDAGVSRNFPIYNSLIFQLRAESFNVTNTPAFANPANNISSPTSFGYSTGLAANTTGRGVNLVGRINF